MPTTAKLHLHVLVLTIPSFVKDLEESDISDLEPDIMLGGVDKERILEISSINVDKILPNRTEVRSIFAGLCTTHMCNAAQSRTVCSVPEKLLLNIFDSLNLDNWCCRWHRETQSSYCGAQ